MSSRALVFAFVAAISLARGLPGQQELPNHVMRRLDYFYSQRRFPFAQLPAHFRRSDVLGTGNGGVFLQGPNTSGPWTSLGPAPITGANVGRVTSLAVDPSSTSTIYLGAAQGGIWKTTNTGASWTPLTDTQCSLAVGAVTLDPANSNIVYVGTGEDNQSLDSYYGCGILKSTDGGASWTALGAAIFDTPTGGAFIGRIRIPGGQGPGASSVLYAATNFGLYKSSDAGTSWTRILTGSATDVTTDPSNASVVYAGVQGSGVYKSTDAGASFSLLAGGLPATSVGRVAVTISPAAPQTVFALVQNAPSGGYLGLFKSTDAGTTWNPLNISAVNCSTYCWYITMLSVDPTNINNIYVGGISLYASTDGGQSFFDIGGGIHADQHALEFEPGNPSVIYSGNDGGINRSANSGGSWASLNTNLAITQFYPGISVGPSGPNQILGGAQDNGTSLYSGSQTWTAVFSGDGGFTAINPGNSAQSFLEIEWGQPSFSGPWRSNGGAYSRANTGINIGDNALFIPPMVMDQARPTTLYFGTQRLYRTTNSGDLWTPAAALSSTGQIAAIGVAQSDSTALYVGTNLGELFVTFNGGTSYALRNAGLAQRAVTAIAVHRSNSLIAYVTVSGFGTGHVFKTVNGGTSWSNVSGNLADVPVNAIVILPDGELDIGTDLGVYRSTDDGNTWALFTGGLPNVAVLDLAYHAGSSALVAATHGRGMWLSTVSVIAPAVALALDVQPGNGSSASVLVQQPVVSVRSGGGDRVVSASNTVTATLNVIAGSGTLSGTAMLAAVSGVTTFTNLKVTGTGTFTLTFTSPGLTSITSNQFIITPAATKVAITVQPSGAATNGVVFGTQPVVQIQDGTGALVSSASNQVTVSLNVISGSGTLGGTLTVGAVNGVATYPNLKITGTGTFTLTFAATGLTSATSGNVVVSAGAAKRLVLATQPAGAVNGVAFTTEPVASILDSLGALVTTATNQVTASLNVISGSGTLGGTLTVAAVNGAATFTNLKITGTGTFTVTFAAAGLTSAVSTNVVVVAGPAVTLALTTQPTGAVNAVAFTTQPVVAIQDAFGATVTTATNQVTVSLNVISGSGTLGGTLTVAAVNGVAGFTNLRISGTGTFTVTFAAAGLTSAVSTNVVVVAGPASTLALTMQPAGAVNGAVFTTQPVVAIQDAFGATVTTATNQVTASLNVITGSGTLAGTATVAAVNGVVTFTNLKITGTGTFTLTLAAAGLNSVTSGNLVVGAGAASTLALTTQPAGAINGVAFTTQPVVAVQDAFGATVTTATNQITASLNVIAGSGTLAGTISVVAVNGVATFTNLKITGTGTFSLTFAAAGLASTTSGSLIVTAAAPVTVVLTTQPAGAVNGLVFTTQPVVQLRDGAGVLVPTASNPVTASLNVISGSGTLGGTLTVAAANGVATFTNLKITGTGIFTLTFAAAGLTSAVSANVVVVVGAASTLALTTQPAGAVDGVIFTTQPVVAIQDAFGATAASATGQVTASLNVISGSGALTGTVSVAAVNGVATFSNLEITGTGTFTLIFAAAGLTSTTSGTLVVAVGAASTLAIVTQPAGAVNGLVFGIQPVVQIRDGSGLLVPSATNPVTASLTVISGGGTLGGTATVAAVNGVATFTNLTITGTGTFTLTFAAIGLTNAVSANLVVVVGAASTLVLTTPPAGAVNGVEFTTQPVVAIQDAFGANVTTATNQVTASLDVISGSGILAGTVSVAAVNGMTTFTNLKITGTGTFSLTFSAPGLTSTTSGNLIVSAAAPVALAITTQPAGAVDGVAFGMQPVVQIRDGTGLLVPSATNPVTASINVISGSGTLGGTLTVAAVNGVATFTNLKIAGTGAFTLTFAATGLTSAVSTNVVVVVGPAATLALTTQPAGAVNGITFTTQPLVAIQDAFGTTISTATNQVTASLNVISGSGTLAGTVSVAAVNGVAAFTNLKITGTGTFALTFAAAGLTSATSGNLVVVVGAASMLAISTQPAGAVNGVAFTSQPVIQILDATGSLLPAAANAVTASLNVIAGTGALGGTVTVAAISGVATFANLRITGIGTFTITFTAAGLTGATSASIVTTTGTPAKLAILTNPSGAQDGIPFAVQPSVEIEDAFGARVNAASGQVSASLNVIAGGGSLGGTAAAAVNGVATFSDLVITGTGTYTLTLTSPGLASAVSSNFVVTPPVASALAVTSLPAGAVDGLVFTAQPVIEIRDAIGRRIPTATNAVTASITGGVGVLSGTLTVSGVGGRATFSDLKISGTGAYTLRFAADALATVSASLTVTARGILHGDVNGDGQVQAIDAQLILQSLVGLPVPQGITLMPNGDADCNGALQVIDAQIILASLVGIDVSKFCVGKVQ